MQYERDGDREHEDREGFSPLAGGWEGRGFGPELTAGSTAERGRHAGKGPRGYRRSDARVREDVCDRLERDGEVDASEIEVAVEEGVVTLDGEVPERSMKRRAETCVEDAPGVRDVQNRLRVAGH